MGQHGRSRRLAVGASHSKSLEILRDQAEHFTPF